MTKREKIEQAVEYNHGKWPLKGDVGRVHWSEPGTECTRTEFEQVARELGWCNGYKYGVEYLCNGVDPELPDDVLVEVKNRVSREWSSENYTARRVAWRNITKFRIVDERYKPKSEDVYINTCGIRPCKNKEGWERCGVDVSDFVLSVTQTDSKIISVEVRSAKRDKTIAAAEHAIESQTNEPANSTHLGILYDAGLLTPNNTP